MQTRKVTIRNRAGIHCRPSSVILNTVKAEFPCHTFVLTAADGDSCELNSIMGLLSLGLSCGDTATLTVEGVDEEKAADRIAELLETEYDFPPKN